MIKKNKRATINVKQVTRNSKKSIYLDNAATTPVRPEVLKVMQPYFAKKFGNASSLHKFGRDAKAALEAARETIAKCIGASADEIVFTSGGTEANNLAIQGIALGSRGKGNHIIISSIEHPSVLETCRQLAMMGFSVTELPVDKYGKVNPQDVENAITEKTILVSIMFANNEIGTIQPIKEIAHICKKHNIYFHTDAVQAFGKLPINVIDIGVDLLSASSHKIGGPKGVGFLYIKKGTKLQPLLHGGGQEFNIRSGTENIAGIVGFAAAAELAVKEMQTEAERLTKLRDKLIKNILAKIPYCMLNGHPSERLPNNVNFSFKFIEGEALVLYLDEYGISASTGSACSSKKLKPSHVLLAIGRTPEEAHGSLRLTLGYDTKEEDINYVLEKLPEVVKRLREISPLGKEIKDMVSL
ncbi:MAG: cysteine desulfurase NifS [Candidatus Nanoarchaeia archaeon]